MIKWMKEHIIRTIIYGLLYILLMLFFVYPLPYEIYMPGSIGLIDNQVVEFDSNYSSSGSFSWSAVTVVTKPTPFQYLISFLDERNERRRLEPSEIKLSLKEMSDSDRIAKIQSIYASLIVAYTEAGESINPTIDGVIISYRTPKAESTFDYFRVNDVIKAINNEVIDDYEEASAILSSLSCEATIKLSILRDGQLIELNIKRHIDEDNIAICYFGLNLENNYVAINGTPSFEIIDTSGYGSSAGLMQALSFYNAITPTDITYGKKISGTGVIDTDGTILPIGGIKQKVYAAIEEGVEIYFAPDIPIDTDGDDIADSSIYLEALEAKELMKSNIIIYPVKTFRDALNYLEETYGNN